MTKRNSLIPEPRELEREIEEALAGLSTGGIEAPAPELKRRRKIRRSLRTPREELVVEGKGETRKVRQAGAADAEGAFVREERRWCEDNLYYFLSTVLDYHWLYPPLHTKVCRWIQTVPPRRKFLLMPRGHCKSTIVAQGLPLHMAIQPAERNLYFPEDAGADVTVLIVGERLERAQDHLRVIEAQLSGNQLFRAFWPHLCWENPKRQAKKWNDAEMIIPRGRELADPTFRAAGIGAATTGSHPKVMIFDDLTTEAAANSPTEMDKAIQWSRAATAMLFDQKQGLIWYTGTRWAVADLPDWHQNNSPEIEFNQEWRQIVEDGEPIYPTKFGYPGCVEELRRIHGTLFPLLYMNSIGDSTLTDFAASDIRFYELVGGNIEFQENELDAALHQQMNAPAQPAVEPNLRGERLTGIV